jgi:APA family basic amino acid/polyamine antiporter
VANLVEPVSAPARPAVAPQGKLLRILGVSFGIAVVIGGTIAAGILRNPGKVAAELGSPQLILAVWLLGGVYAFLGALSVTELGTMLPRAGGYYVYARRALGDYAGFTVGWSDWLSGCTSLAYMAVLVGEFAAALAPALQGSVRNVALATLLLFAVVHGMGLRLSSRVQELASLLKALAFVGLVGACFAFGPDQPAAGAGGGMPATPWYQFAALVIALQFVIGTYDGWQGAIYFTEEDRDPARNLPRSILGGLAAVVGIYLLVNLALLWVLPFSRLAGSSLPLADAAQELFGPRGGRLITALALVSLLGALNANLFVPTRVLFALSRDRLFAREAAAVSPRGTPTGALLWTTLGSCLLVAVSGRFEQLFTIFSFFAVANYSACFVSLFVLRRREPRLPRPFRAWGYPWTTLLALAGSVIFLVGFLLSDTVNGLYALGLLALSYPAYRLVLKTRADLSDPTEEGR